MLKDRFECSKCVLFVCVHIHTRTCMQITEQQMFYPIYSLANMFLDDVKNAGSESMHLLSIELNSV